MKTILHHAYSLLCRIQPLNCYVSFQMGGCMITNICHIHRYIVSQFALEHFNNFSSHAQTESMAYKLLSHF